MKRCSGLDANLLWCTCTAGGALPDTLVTSVSDRQVSGRGGPSCRPLYDQIKWMKTSISAKAALLLKYPIAALRTKRVQRLIDKELKSKWAKIPIRHTCRDAIKQWVEFLKNGIPLIDVLRLPIYTAMVDAAIEPNSEWGFGGIVVGQCWWAEKHVSTTKLWHAGVWMLHHSHPCNTESEMLAIAQAVYILTERLGRSDAILHVFGDNETACRIEES